MSRLLPLALVAATAGASLAAPALAQTAADEARFRAAQERYDSETQIFRQEQGYYEAARRRGGGRNAGRGYDSRGYDGSGYDRGYRAEPGYAPNPYPPQDGYAPQAGYPPRDGDAPRGGYDGRGGRDDNGYDPPRD